MNMTPDEIAAFRRLAATADADRHANRWPEALAGYREAVALVPELAALHHDIALCHLALGDFSAAAASSQQALQLNPALWQAQVVRIKALRKLGQADEALAEIAKMPAAIHAALEVERANLALNALGDADQASRLVAPYADDPSAREDARLIAVLAALYDPGDSDAQELSDRLAAFACEHLGAAAEAAPLQKSALATRRRIGIISPQLCASPVYFCGIGALKCLAAEADLMFFHRGGKDDWATQEFRSIAAGWIDTALLDSGQLDAELRRHELDVLIDMGGWMDTRALRALSARPARKLFKWIGGQSATTGLKCFDGFLSDIHQSPPGLQVFYTEPLLLLDSGYVSYLPPPYMPAPSGADPGIVLGIIANPVKLSRAFLADLGTRLRMWRREGIEPTLRFIETRYRHEPLRTRIQAALGDDAALEFITPTGHEAYLKEVGRLTAVIDSFPYTGGLTTLEALYLGVPCYTRAGKLFSQRHSYAHCRYAGLADAEFMLDGYLPRAANAGPRRSLLESGCPRLDHAALADNLLACSAAAS